MKSRNHLEVACPSCQLAIHDADAQFCKICGEKLQKPIINQLDSKINVKIKYKTIKIRSRATQGWT